MAKNMTTKSTPSCYWSRKMTQAERGYAIYDKELLALISLVMKHVHFTCNTDHRALESMQTQAKLKGRQIRWILFLQEFDFSVVYQPAGKMRVADWLTRNPTMHTLCTKCSKPMDLRAATTSQESTLGDQVRRGYTQDTFATKLLTWQQQPLTLDTQTRTLLNHFTQHSGLWYFNDSKTTRNRPQLRARLYIPDDRPLRTALLGRYHDSLAAGHLAFEKTVHQLEKYGMRAEVKQHTASCEICQRRQQESNHSKYGLLHPLPIAEDRATDLSIDWFFLNTSTEGYDSVMVVICRLTKPLVLIPCKKTDTAEQSAQQFMFSRGMGLPPTITSDRDSEFTSAFWTEVTKGLQIQTSFSTTRHQQANGQAEI